MKRKIGQILALIMTVLFMGGTAGITVSAQEAEENNSETAEDSESSDTEKSEEDTEETTVKITGMKATLDCAEAVRNMSWDFFSDNKNSTNWVRRLNLSDYAADLYFVLLEGADNDGEQDILIEDSAFSEETAVKMNYSNGKEEVFNGIEVLDISVADKMDEEEWAAIQENIKDAYNAFRLDHPEVFWLNDAPKVSRVCTVKEDDEGAETYEYKIYFQLKSHSRSYDIRNKGYQSEKAVKEGIVRRDQSIQQVFEGVKRKGPAEMTAYFNEEMDIVVNSIGLDANNAAYGLKMLCDYGEIPCVLASGAGGIMDAYVRIDDVWYMASEVETELIKSDVGSSNEDTGEEDGKRIESLPALRSMKVTSFAEKAREGMVDSLKKDAYLERRVVKEDKETYEKIDELEEFFSVNEEPYYYSTWGEVVPLALADYTDIYLFVADSDNPDGGSRYKVDKDSFGLLGAASDTRIMDDAGAVCAYTIIYNLQGDTAGEDSGAYHIFSDNVTIKRRLLKVERGNLELVFERGDETGSTAGVKEGTHLDFVGIVNDDFQIDMERDVEIFPILVEWDKGIVAQMTVRLKTDSDSGVVSNYMITEEGESFAIIKDVPFAIAPKKIENLSDITVSVEGGPYTYDGSAKMPKVTVTVGKETLEENIDYKIDYKGSNINAGKATVYITSLSGSGKYIWNGEKTGEFQIEQAVWPRRTDSVFVRYGAAGEYNLDKGLLAFDGKIDSENISADDDVFSEPPAAGKDSILKYKIKEDESLAGNAFKVLIPVKDSVNFEPYEIELTVNVTEKNPQTDFKFEYEALKKPIRESAYKIPAAGAAEGSTVAYESSDPAVASVDEEGNVTALTEGNVIITATASETADYMEGRVQYRLNVVESGHKVDILKLPAEGEQEYRLEIEEGISDTDVPDIFKTDTDLGLDTGAKIEARLRTEVKSANTSIQDTDIAVYDITLLVKKDGSWEWEAADDIEFITNKDLQGGFTAVIPYPEGIKKDTYDFTVVHMFTETLKGNLPGHVEIPEVTETEKGIQFDVTSLSPVAVGWAEPRIDDGDDNNGDDNNGDDNNGDDNNGDDNNGSDNNGNGSNGNDNNGGDNNKNDNNNFPSIVSGGTDSGNNGSGSGSGTSAGAGNGSTTGNGSSTGNGAAAAGTGNVSSAKTGDAAQVLIYMILFGSAAVLTGGILLVKRKYL